jgi:hypothetical protein
MFFLEPFLHCEELFVDLCQEVEASLSGWSISPSPCAYPAFE